MGVGVINYMPVLEINYSQDAQERSLEFSLPLFIHKLIRPNQVALEAYENFYREYTISNSNVIFKLDEFINNPAPPNVPMPAVLKKFGDLLTGIFKLNVNVFPNPSEFKKIWATGQYFYKPETEQKPVLLPVLVELEWYETNTRQLRMSLRCGGSPYINYAIFQMVQLYTAGVPSSPAMSH